VKGDTLVSNFNDKAERPRYGHAIMEVAPGGSVHTFANIEMLPASDSCPGGIGLTTALSILPGGWVVVGSLPTGEGGSLPSVNPAGASSCSTAAAMWQRRGPTQTSNGPWDMTSASTASGADLFVANSLSRPKGLDKTPPVGDCTVVRISVSLASG